jgi:hypothetical protein
MTARTPRSLLVALAENTAMCAAHATSAERIHRLRLEGKPKYAPGALIANLPEEDRALLQRLKSDDLQDVLFCGDVFTERTARMDGWMSDDALKTDLANKWASGKKPRKSKRVKEAKDKVPERVPRKK